MPDHGGVGRHIVQHHGVGADPGVVADGDRPQHLGAGADDHVVADRRVALAAHGAGHAEGHLVVKIAVVADLGGFADHHAHAVVDHQPPAELGGRMDLDPGQPAGDMRGKPAQQVQLVLATASATAVPHDGVQARVAQQDLERRPCRRVAFPICPDSLTQEHESHATIPL